MISSSPLHSPQHGGSIHPPPHQKPFLFLQQLSPANSSNNLNNNANSTHDLPPFDFELGKGMSNESTSPYPQISPQMFPYSSPHSFQGQNSSTSSSSRAYGFSVSHPSVKVNHNLSHLLQAPLVASSTSNSSSSSSSLSPSSSTASLSQPQSSASPTTEEETTPTSSTKRSGFRQRSVSLKEATMSESRPQVLSTTNGSTSSSNNIISDLESKTTVEVIEVVEEKEQTTTLVVEDDDAFAGVEADFSDADESNNVQYERLKDDDEGGAETEDRETKEDEEATAVNSSTLATALTSRIPPAASDNQKTDEQAALPPRLTSPGIVNLREEDSDGDSSFDMLEDEERREGEGLDTSQWVDRIETLLGDLIEQGKAKEAYFALESLMLGEQEEYEEGEIDQEDEEHIPSDLEEQEEIEQDDDVAEVNEEGVLDGEEVAYEEEESSLLSPEALSEGIVNIEVIINEIGARISSIIGQRAGDDEKAMQSVLFDKEAMDILNEFTIPLVKSFGFESVAVHQQIWTSLERQRGEVILLSKNKFLKEISDLLYDELVLSVLIEDVDRQYDLQIQKLQAEQERLQQHIDRLENTRKKELARLHLK